MAAGCELMSRAANTRRGRRNERKLKARRGEEGGEGDEKTEGECQVFTMFSRRAQFL